MYTPDLTSASQPGRELLEAVTAATADLVGTSFLRALVRRLAAAFEADLVLVAEGPERRRVIASWPCGENAPDGAQLEHRAAVALETPDGTQTGELTLLSSRPIEPSDEELAVLRVLAARAAAEIERLRDEEVLRLRAAEVAASRARVVEAADEERCRIGGAIHDGAQQDLVVLGHFLAMARRKLDSDPQAAAGLIEKAREHLAGTSGALRELARDLHPSRLTDQGLGPAIAGLTAGSSVDVRVDSLPECRLPGRIETALLQLVSEAVSRAASKVTVRIEKRGETIVADATADGPAGERGPRPIALCDRVAVLGGTLAVDGTRLEALIPLAATASSPGPHIELGAGERLIAQVKSGEKTASVSVARRLEIEGGPPQAGQRLALLDQHGTVEVERSIVVPFAEIPADAIQADTPGATPDEWRENQRAFYAARRSELALELEEPGWRFTEETPMTVVWFRVAPA